VDDQPQQPSPFVSWQFLLFLAAALGMFFAQSPNLAIPPTKNADNTAKLGKRIDSYLWEDPYAAFEETSNAGPDQVSDFSILDLPSPIVPQDPKTANNLRICILPVIVRGDLRSTEAQEVRIRFRGAVVSGLGACGMAPDDPTHLRLVRLPITLPASPADQPKTIISPVEWYLAGHLPRQTAPLFNAVLVVWLQDSALNDQPLKTLQAIRKSLADRIVARAGNTKIDFRVIGPYWSGNLADIIAESPEDGAGISFYSATATMADGALDLFAPKGNASGGRMRFQRNKSGPSFINLTCSDEDLAGALLHELNLRGIDPTDPATRIAIISDWDTDYGKVLPLTFAAILQAWKKNNVSVEDSLSWHMDNPLTVDDYSAISFDDVKGDRWPVQILRAYYISGVDGKLTTGSVRKPSGQEDQKSEGTINPVFIQKAEGEQQIDYIARLGKDLADRITDRDGPAATGSNEPLPKLRAIGIFGTGVYDKLVLLQALHPLFKQAIFFTDSIDARYLDSVDALSYTRNLVIASPFGLELNRNLQVGAPPFRSSEQTAAFLAVQAAAGTDDPNTLEGLQTQLEIPLRFEIGRTKEVPLFVPDQPPKDASPSNMVDRFHGALNPPDPEEPPIITNPLLHSLLEPKSFIANVLLCSVAAVLLIILGRLLVADTIKGFNWGLSIFVAILVSGTTAYALSIYRQYDRIEPSEFLEGVSIWPSQIIKLIALIFSTISVCACYASANTARVLLEKQFHFAVEGTTTPSPGIRSAIKDFFRSTFAHERVDYLGPNSQVDASKMWAHYCGRTTVVRRTCGALITTIVFWILTNLLLDAMFDSTRIPFRGEQVVLVNYDLRRWAYWVASFLMFLVIDKMHVCTKIVEALGRDEPTKWPVDAYEEISALKPSPGGDLTDEGAASRYLDIYFIGRVTAEFVKITPLPFIAFSLLLLSRWTYFGAWQAGPSVIAINVLMFGACILSAVTLRFAALRAKARALRRLGLHCANLRASGPAMRADALELLRNEVAENREGVYLPWHQQPFVSALLIPFGGTGGIQLIEFLMNRY
jgi:hypothetical protein